MQERCRAVEPYISKLHKQQTDIQAAACVALPACPSDARPSLCPVVALALVLVHPLKRVFRCSLCEETPETDARADISRVDAFTNASESCPARECPVRLLSSFLLISSALAGMGDVYCPDAFCPASYECWVRAPLIILRLAQTLD